MGEERPRGVGGPVIENLNSKLATLERRADYLARRAKSDDPGRKSTTREYDAQEAGALRAAITALTYHRASLGDEDTATVVLAEIVDAIEERETATTREERDQAQARLDDVRRRARIFVDNLD